MAQRRSRKSNVKKDSNIDPETLEHRILYDNNGNALINGVSVAIDAGDAFYVGSFQGNRVVKVPR